MRHVQPTIDSSATATKKTAKIQGSPKSQLNVEGSSESSENSEAYQVPPKVDACDGPWCQVTVLR